MSGFERTPVGSANDAPGVHIDVGVVTAFHLVDLDHIAVGRGVDELTVSDINPHMGDGFAGAIFEKYQITRLKLVFADGYAILELVGGSAVEGVAEMGVYVLCLLYTSDAADEL